MNKPKEEFIELADTIHDTPVFSYDNTTPKYVNSKINDNHNKFEENIYLNNHFSNIEKGPHILNDVKKDKKLDDKIILQRENRRIISMIKKIINKKDSPNETKLYIKNLLINYKKDITLLKDDKRNTLLHIFTEAKDVSSLKIILEIYIDFLSISKQFYEFLFLKNMDSQNIFDICVQKGDIPIIKLLYEQIEKENNYYEKIVKMKYIQNYLFHIAANNNQIFPILFFYEKLKNFFSNNNNILNSNESNKDKMAPIHYACKNRNIKIMNLLLDLGANINIQDKKGYTPLHYAVINNDERMIKHLLIRGSNKKIKDENNLTPYNLSSILGDNNMAKILYHKNCCQKQFCGEEIGPISKRNNMKIILIGLMVSIIIKISIIIRFYCVLNDVFIDFTILTSFNNDNNNYSFNNSTNEQDSKELDLNDFFSCVDSNCQFEVGIIFFSLFIDFLLLLNFFIFKCSKNIFVPKQNESLSTLFEENENGNICVKCRIIINENTQHCLVCDRCVENWDHHCFWLNTCINNKNYTKFKFFIFSAILFLIVNLIFFIVSIYLLLSSKDLFMKKIFNISDGSFWKKILTVIFTCIHIYLIIFIAYSLIFVVIPIIKYLCKKYSKNKGKKNKKEKEKEVDYKKTNSIIDKEEDDDEDVIKIETNIKGI